MGDYAFGGGCLPHSPAVEQSVACGNRESEGSRTLSMGEGRFAKTVPIYFSTDNMFDVGEDWGTPISPTYKLPFMFTRGSGRASADVP